MGRSGLGEFEHRILLVILRQGGEAYSVPIVQALEELTGREASTSAVYIALRRLERRGLLTSRKETPEESGSPYPRRWFAVTEAAMEPLRSARKALLKLWDGLEPVLDD